MNMVPIHLNFRQPWFNYALRDPPSCQGNADIRDVGEELSKGQLLANQGQHLTVGAIAALSMAGVFEVEVYCYPRVAVVITGDEVAQNLKDFAAGMIFDANAPLIQAWFAERQQQVQIFHVADTEFAVVQLIQQLKHEYDVILTTGGVSVGDYDFVRPVALAQGFQQIFWKVKQKPGKPMLFAEFQRSPEESCYLLGLPGNPAAVFVGMQVYTSTLLQALQGQAQLPNWFTATLTQPIKSDARERFLRMHACNDSSAPKVALITSSTLGRGRETGEVIDAEIFCVNFIALFLTPTEKGDDGFR